MGQSESESKSGLLLQIVGDQIESENLVLTRLLRKTLVSHS